MEGVLTLLSPSQFSAFQSLSPEKQQQFLYEFGKVAKDPKKAVLFMWLLGCHYLFLGEVLKQILFWFTLGGFLIWLVYDLFTLKKRIIKRNEQLADNLLIRFK